MEVRLIAATPDPLMVIGSAAAITRGTTHDGFTAQVERRGRKWLKGFVRNLYDLGHWSVFEFCEFDFEVVGASRVFETQAVRSRVGSYEWESGRHNQVYEPDEGAFANGTYIAIQNGISEYEILMALGMPAETARYALPQGVARKGRIRKNFRALMETGHQRLCAKTQLEYRAFMMECKRLVEMVEPVLAELLVPKCKWLGYCIESDGCGLMRPRREVLCGGGDMREM